jgi:hypothetical protein
MPEIDEEIDVEHSSGSLIGSVSRAERDRASQRRDEIAKEMWASYQNTTTQRRRK